MGTVAVVALVLAVVIVVLAAALWRRPSQRGRPGQNASDLGAHSQRGQRFARRHEETASLEAGRRKDLGSSGRPTDAAG